MSFGKKLDLLGLYLNLVVGPLKNVVLDWVTLWNKKHFFEWKDCNPRDTDSSSNSTCTLERARKSGVYKGQNYKMQFFHANEGLLAKFIFSIVTRTLLRLVISLNNIPHLLPYSFPATFLLIPLSPSSQCPFVSSASYCHWLPWWLSHPPFERRLWSWDPTLSSSTVRPKHGQ